MPPFIFTLFAQFIQRHSLLHSFLLGTGVWIEESKNSPWKSSEPNERSQQQRSHDKQLYTEAMEEKSESSSLGIPPSIQIPLTMGDWCNGVGR
jgi:hypothetical protein